MKQFYIKQSMCRILKAITSLVLIVALVVCADSVSVLAKDAIGTRITIEKIDGDASVVKANGKKAPATTGVKLAATEKLRTDKASYAYISIDDDKVIKLDELTEVNVKKSGNKLSVEVSEGNIFFEVKEKLESNESMNLNAASMAMSIRGTAGTIGVRRVGDNIESSAEIVEGRVDISYSDVSGKGHEFVLNGGEECSHIDGSDEVNTDDISLEDFPGFVAVELEDNEELCEKIAEDNDLDFKWLIEHAEELLSADQEFNSKNYGDVFEEGSKHSVASKQKERPAQINKFLKSFWGETTGLVPERAGMITPTPLPSQAPVNTITITPKPTAVANKDTNNNSNNNQGQGSTMIIAPSGYGAPPPGSVSVNTVPPSIIGMPPVTPTPAPSQPAYTGPTEEEIQEARLKQFLRDLAAYRAFSWLMDLINSGDEEEVDDRPIYVVTFIGQDGKTVLATQQVREGDSATPPEAPLLPGYIFSSWGGMLNDVNSNRKIYALYSKERFTVTFYDSKSENPTNPYYVETDVLANDYASAPMAPMHEGYNFTGWATSTEGGLWLQDTPITGNMIFYANYENAQKKWCLVTFTGFDGERLGIKEVENGYVLEKSDIPIPPERIDDYYYTGWNEDPYGYTVTQDTYFEALYKRDVNEDSYFAPSPGPTPIVGSGE